MMTTRNYVLDGVEYMVLDSRSLTLDDEGIRRLLNRRAGVGADRLVVYHSQGWRPMLTVFTADGEGSEAAREDYLILALYLRDENIKPRGTELARALGEAAFLDIQAASERATRLEFHVTEAFCAKIAMPCAELKVA